jgi:hypothetical protein
MDKTQIILFTAAMVFLAIRLYQKYLKKNKNKNEVDIKSSPGSSFSTEDAYEPYSKK